MLLLELNSKNFWKGKELGMEKNSWGFFFGKELRKGGRTSQGKALKIREGILGRRRCGDKADPGVPEGSGKFLEKSQKNPGKIKWGKGHTGAASQEKIPALIHWIRRCQGWFFVGIVLFSWNSGHFSWCDSGWEQWESEENFYPGKVLE